MWRDQLEDGRSREASRIGHLWVLSCIVTLATIGYGDFTPKTSLGKLLPHST
ncbi:MAG TPA: potassium channel family protein [Anaerolineae bacterium]|nr:potassium channel family protein [Anaerolineae bacterium]